MFYVGDTLDVVVNGDRIKGTITAIHDNRFAEINGKTFIGLNALENAIMSKVSENMRFNGEFVDWCEIVAREINELASNMDCPQRLADVVGETSEALGKLTKAIDAAKKAIRETELSVIEGNNWHVTVVTNERAIVDQSRVRSILGDETPMKVTNVTSVKFVNRWGRS